MADTKEAVKPHVGGAHGEEDADAGLNQALLSAAGEGDAEKTRDLLRRGADSSFQEEEEGRSALMLAAEKGHMDVVVVLLERGAPWNALDRRGKCAGQYAFQNEHVDVANRILNAGVSAELIFAAVEKKTQLVTSQASANNKEYISRPVEYKEGDLVDDEKRGVMMMWEKPIMEAHAELICRAKGDVLNIGFGLGLVDTAIQQHSPRSHTIIEAHPEVYKRMLADGWDKRPGVTVIHARWQDAVDQLPQFDGIFFDTFDDVLHMHEFHQHLPKLLRKGGVYTFFNGICSDNYFFHAVACQVLEIQLKQELGLSSVFQPLNVACGDDDTWKNVKYRYFDNDTYHFPIIFWTDAPPPFLLDDTASGEEEKAEAQEAEK